MALPSSLPSLKICSQLKKKKKNYGHLQGFEHFRVLPLPELFLNLKHYRIKRLTLCKRNLNYQGQMDKVVW